MDRLGAQRPNDSFRLTTKQNKQAEPDLDERSQRDPLQVLYMDQHKVLFLGDSWADRPIAKPALEDLCPGVTVRQEALGGTRASQWARESTLLEERLQQLANDNFVPDVVWITMGGNDLLQTFCSPPGGPSQITQDVQTVMDRLGQEFPNLESIVYTGCGIPPRAWVRECATAFRATCTASGYPDIATVVSIEELFGGLLNETHYGLSDLRFFEDELHLNRDGYLRLFSYEPVARGLGCYPTTTTPTAETISPFTYFPGPFINFFLRIYAFFGMISHAMASMTR